MGSNLLLVLMLVLMLVLQFLLPNCLLLVDVSTIDYSICESQLGYDIASSRTGKIHRAINR